MRRNLEAFHGDVLGSDLAAHAARDALIVVADGLDLLEVGAAVAADDTPRVEGWVRGGELRKPSAADLARWPADPAAVFESVIVAPFVLIRPRRRTPDPLAN
jgi:hypothetical protein